MEGVSELQNCFLIDLRSRRVFCRSCGNVCRRLVLPGFTQYWCANHECTNSGEVRCSRDGKWSTYSVVEIWFGNRCSRFSSRLIASRQGGKLSQE